MAVAENPEISGQYTYCDDFKNNATSFIRQHFPQVTELARQQHYIGLGYSSLGSSGLDNQEVYVQPLLESYVEVYEKIYIKFGDLASAFVQYDLDTTKCMLSQSIMTTKYDQNWMTSFIQENAIQIMGKYQQNVDMFTFKTPLMNEWADFLETEWDGSTDTCHPFYDVLQGVMMDLDNPPAVDAELAAIPSSKFPNDVAKATLYIAFDGVRKFLVQQYPDMKMNPVQLMEPLTKATLAENDDVFVGGAQFSKHRVQQAIIIAESGLGIEMVAEVLFKKPFRNLFIANKITFHGLHNFPGFKLLAIYRLSKFIMTERWACLFDDINSHLLGYMGFPTLEEQKKIDAHLYKVGNDIQQDVWAVIRPQWINLIAANMCTNDTVPVASQSLLDRDPNTEHANDPNDPSANSSGYCSISGSFNNVNCSNEHNSSQPPQSLKNTQTPTFVHIPAELFQAAYAEYKDGGCGPGSEKAGKKIFKGIFSILEQTFPLKLKGSEATEENLKVYNAKKKEMFDLIKFWEIQDIPDSRYEQNWDKLRKDHLGRKIISETSSQLRHK